MPLSLRKDLIFPGKFSVPVGSVHYRRAALVRLCVITIEAKIRTGMTMCRGEQQGDVLSGRHCPCLQSASQPEGLGLTLRPPPGAWSVFSTAADCKLWLFSPAAEGPGVVLFLGVFWSPLQAANWRQQKD